MFVIRPIALKDLDGIERLAHRANLGITSLAKDRRLLEQKIFNSLQSFSSIIEKPGNQLYFFVLEETETGKIVGSSAIFAKTGTEDAPFLSFRIEDESHESPEVDIETHFQVLHLQVVRGGPTELGTLYLHPNYRKYGVGRLLSLCRFLFMAGHPERFEESVVAEMRGYIDERGVCPFWEYFCRHFFHMDFSYANILRAEDTNFIFDLIPKYPVYTVLFPPEVQRLLGKTHPHTLPGLKLLEAEGFIYNNHIDIFDAGPHVSCETKKIHCIQRSHVVTLQKTDEEEYEGEPWLICTDNLDFRACRTPLRHYGNESIGVSSAVADALQVTVGDRVRIATSYPPKPE